MDSFERHLRAASGYLDLGMIEDCSVELDQIDPKDALRPEVHELQVAGGFRPGTVAEENRKNLGGEFARESILMNPARTITRSAPSGTFGIPMGRLYSRSPGRPPAGRY